MKKVLENHHIDLAIMWRDVEKLTYRECVERLVDLFGEDIRITTEALTMRVGRRVKEIGNGGYNVPRRITNPENLTDDELLEWMRYLMYTELYIAKAKNDSGEIRRSIDTTLKVLKHKRDVGTNDEDEDSKAMNALLKSIRAPSEAAN